MKNLKFIGKTLSRYGGMDGDKIIRVNRGESVQVSDEKAKQLLTDFPDNWVEGEPGEDKKGKKGK